MSTRLTPALSDRFGGGRSYYAPGSPLRERLLILILFGAVVLAEMVLALAVVRPGAGILLAPFAGVVGLGLAFAFPFAATLAFLGLIGTLLYSTYFSVSFGVTATAPQLMLGALVVVALVRPRRRTLGGAPGAGLAVFLALIGLGAFVAVSAGRVDETTARNFALPFTYFLFYYVVIRLYPEPERMKRLLDAALILAGVTGAIALFVALFGSTSSFLQDPSAAVISDDEGLGGLLRVRLPGVAFAYGLFWYGVFRVLEPAHRRALWIAVLAGCVLSIAVSLNRNMWLGLIFGFGLVIAVGGAATRRRLLLSFIAAAAAIALLVLAGPQAVGPSSKLAPLVKRGETLLSPGQELQDQSLRDRGNETEAAVKALQGHWVFGLGVGAPFGVSFRDSLGGGRYQDVDQTFLHNQYLYLIVAGGVGALIAFLVFLGSTLLCAWRARGREPTMIALFAGLAMIMLSAFVMIAFVDYTFMALVSLIAAAVFVLSSGSPPDDRVARRLGT